MKIVTSAFTKLPSVDLPKGMTINQLLSVRGQHDMPVYLIDSAGQRGKRLARDYKIKTTDCILIEPCQLASTGCSRHDSQASD